MGSRKTLGVGVIDRSRKTQGGSEEWVQEDSGWGWDWENSWGKGNSTTGLCRTTKGIQKPLLAVTGY